MAKPSNNPVERERRYGSSLILYQHEACLGRAYLGNGSGHRAWQVAASSDRLLYLRLSGRNRVDEIRVEKQRGMLDDPGRDFRLIVGETEKTAGGASALNASARASSARTSGEGSSSSMISAPSAAARSSGPSSE
jgi:hypothetical protein